MVCVKQTVVTEISCCRNDELLSLKLLLLLPLVATALSNLKLGSVKEVIGVCVREGRTMSKGGGEKKRKRSR